MKLNSANGKGSGKCGDAIYQIVGGVQIKRSYRASIANPSTEGQVRQRSKIKLAAQLGASLAPVIAIPAKGLQTYRNRFAKRNMELIEVVDGVASVNVERLQLTEGTFGIPDVLAWRSDLYGLRCELAGSASGAIDFAFYIVIKKTEDDKLMVVDTMQVNDAGRDGRFQAKFPYYGGEIIIFVYGVKIRTIQARARYADFRINSAEDMASLVLSKRIKALDYRFSYTRGTTIYEGDSESHNHNCIIRSVNSLPAQKGGSATIAPYGPVIITGVNLVGRWSIDGISGYDVLINDAGTQVTINFAFGPLSAVYQLRYNDQPVMSLVVSTSETLEFVSAYIIDDDEFKAAKLGEVLPAVPPVRFFNVFGWKFTNNMDFIFVRPNGNLLRSYPDSTGSYVQFYSQQWDEWMMPGSYIEAVNDNEHIRIFTFQ